MDTAHKLIKAYSVNKEVNMGFPGGSVVKNPPENAGDAGSTPGSGRFPGEEIGNPLQYSRWGSSMEPGGRQPMGSQRAAHD